MIVSKVNMDSAVQAGTTGGKACKEKHDLNTQNVFRRVVARAERRGMVVNKKKTQILCFSDTLTYRAMAFFEDGDGERISPGEAGKMKVLGFHLDGRPSVHAHVEALKIRMQDTTWVLRHLKRAGFSEKELAVVYRTVVRPVLDYCAVMYHLCSQMNRTSRLRGCRQGR